MYWLKSFATQFQTITLPSQNPDHYVGAGQIDRGIFLKMPGGGVIDTQGGDPASADAIITLRGSISRKDMTQSQLIAYERQLRGLVGWDGTLTRIWDNAEEHTCHARCLSANATRRIQDLNSLEVDMSWQRTSRVWSGAAQDELITLATNPQTYNLPSGGNALIENFVITVTPSGSDITQVEIKWQTPSGASTYSDLLFTGTIPVDQALVIDTGAKSVLLNGVDAYANFSFGPDHKMDPWFRLLGSEYNGGLQRIQIVRTGGSAASWVRFQYNDAWT